MTLITDLWPLVPWPCTCTPPVTLAPQIPFCSFLAIANQTCLWQQKQFSISWCTLWTQCSVKKQEHYLQSKQVPNDIRTRKKTFETAVLQSKQTKLGASWRLDKTYGLFERWHEYYGTNLVTTAIERVNSDWLLMSFVTSICVDSIMVKQNGLDVWHHATPTP